MRDSLLLREEEEEGGRILARRTGGAFYLRSLAAAFEGLNFSEKNDFRNGYLFV